MPQPSEDFGGYVLERLLGKGGMAWVYLARQKSIGRRVAVKILFPHLAEEENVAARFEREARTAGMMQHENICQIYEFGRHEGSPFIALDFIDGMNLRDWVEAHGVPPVEIALVLLRDVARGLEHAHAPGRDVIHRDLKPLNIMLSKDGMVKLLDFGLARALSEDIFKTRTEGLVAGTVPYMSPEQAAGRFPDGEAGKLSDIFSLGIVFYELLGGRRPFRGDHASEITRAIQSFEPPALDLLNPLVPAEVANLVRDMLAKAPQRRVQQVTQVVEVLESALDRLEVKRERALLREYVANPAATADKLRRQSVERHLQRGLHFRTLGHTRVDDALQEFMQVVHLDGTNKVARRHVEELESEIRNRKAREQRMDETVREVSKVFRPPGAYDETVESQPSPVPRRAPAWRMVAGIAIAVVAVAAAGWFFVPKPSPSPPGPAPTQAPTPAPTTAPTPTPTPPPVPATGMLTLAVSPENATVALDGGAPGKIRRFEELPEGAHRVRVEAPGHRPEERQAFIQGGRVTSLSVQLAALPAPSPAPSPASRPAQQPAESRSAATGFGYLKVVSTTDYYGEIWVDGAFTGQQTAAMIRVPAGPHEVWLVHEGFRAKEGRRQVTVAPGETLVVRFTVERDS